MNNSDRHLRDACEDHPDKNGDDHEEKSNVIEIDQRRRAIRNLAANLVETDAKEVILKWKELSPHIKRVLDTYEELGIDTVALGYRILNQTNDNIEEIIIHLREFTALILRALELSGADDVHIIRIHPDKRMGRVALDFAEKNANNSDDSPRQKLMRMYQWLAREEANAKIVKIFNRRLK